MRLHKKEEKKKDLSYSHLKLFVPTVSTLSQA